MIEKIKENESFIIFKNFFLTLFSFKGIYSRLEFYVAMIFARIIFNVLKGISNDSLMTFGAFIDAYIMLASYQKRCRDFGSKGTLVILIVSIFWVYLMILHPSGLDLQGIFHPISIVLMILYFSALLYTLFYPGNDKKNLELTSPLLKYPRAYFALGVVLVLAGRYVVDRYYL